MASTSCLAIVGGSGNNTRWVPLDIKIMIIDEDPTSLFFVAKLLETCHYKVESFENPVDALHVLRERQEEYDLVIMDLDCINMRGFDLLDIIARKMNIPVTTTCYDDSEKIRTQALFSGACCHIVKPITVNNLEFVWMKEWRFSVKRKESKKQRNGRGRVDCSSNTVSADDLDSNKNSKTRLHWDEKLHVRFLIAVSLLGDEANSKSIMGIMNVEGLTGNEVSSHLQKHKLRLQKEKESNFSPLILPLHQFPTSMKLSFSMPNRESNPMVIEDNEDWTTDELLGVNEAPEFAQHDHQMVDSSNGLDINFDFLSEFLDFDFETNDFIGESEAIQHDCQMIHSLKGSKIDFDFDSEFLNFTSESNKFMDGSEAAQHDQQMPDSSNGFDVDFDFESNHFMDESEAAPQGADEAPEAAQHDHQMVDSSNGIDINSDFLSEFLDFDFESNNFVGESVAVQHDNQMINSSNGLDINFDFIPEILDSNFDSHNVMGESEALQHDRQMIQSVNGSEIDLDFDAEYLNFNFETNKFMEDGEAAQPDQQMLDSSNGFGIDFDFESNCFVGESEAAAQGGNEAPANARTQGGAHFTAAGSAQLERPKTLHTNYQVTNQLQ